MSRFVLVRDAQAGTVQLIEDSVTVWSSDNDPGLLEDLGIDALEDEDMGDVLEYLVSNGYLTDAEADEIPVDSPEDDDDDDDDEDDDEEDEEDEDEDEDESEAVA